MNIIRFYILKQHIAPFLFGSLTVVFIFLMQFIMNYLDQLLGKGLSELIILQLITYNMAWMVILAVPMGVLFSTLMAFGSLSANHEITVIKASGGSLLKMMLPVIAVSILLSAGLFLFNDIILPESNHRAKVMMNDIKRKKPTFNLESGKFSMDIDGYTILSRRVDSISGNLYGVTIYDHKQPKMRNIISADSGYVQFAANMERMIVTLMDGEIHQMELNEVNNYKIINFEEYIIGMRASGFSFDQTDDGVISRGDREMTIDDMQAIVNESEISKLEAVSKYSFLVNSHYTFLTGNEVKQENENNGFQINNPEPKSFRTTIDASDSLIALTSIEKRLNFVKSTLNSDESRYKQYDRRVRQYKVEIQKKYAIPFACLLFVFVGCPLGIMTKGGNFGVSAGISLLFYIFYWACLIGGEKLADRGLLAPEISMWFGNFIIAFLGLVLTMKVNYESLRFLKIFQLFRR